MDFLSLILLFFGTGVLAMAYYHLVPSREVLRERLPNRVTGAGILLALVVGGAFWYIVATSSGFGRFSRISTLVFSLLTFESFFLLLLRWLRSTSLSVLASLILAAGLLAVHLARPSFAAINTIVIIATLGATTLLIRAGLLSTLGTFLVAAGWTLYDSLVATYLVPRVFVPLTQPPSHLLFPSVIIGQAGIGSGDFMFLALFSLVMLRDFGRLAAFTLIATETVALIVTALAIGDNNTVIPFLLVMAPVFFLVYLVARINQKHSARPEGRQTP